MADIHDTTGALSRRGLFGGAGKLAAVGALAAFPAVAAAALDPHPDAAIIAGLYRWRDAVRAYVASPLDIESDEWCAMLDAADDEFAAIARMPAHTIDGLAIKAHMALRHEYSGRRDNELMPNFDGGTMADQSLPMSVGADLLRLSPTLAAAVTRVAQ